MSFLGNLGKSLVSGLGEALPGSILGGVASYVTAKDNRKWNEKMLDKQNEFNAEEAQKAREWNQQMDNTKYQRQVADMQAAGVNPALAMSGGVSTQATSNATASSASAMPAELDLSSVAQLAMQSKQLKIQDRLAKSQENLQAALAKKADADAEKTTTETGWINDLSAAQLEQMKANAAKALSDIDVNTSVIEVNGVRIDLYSAQTGLFNAQMSKTEKEAQLVEVNTAIANLEKQKLEIMMPYVEAYQKAGLALQEAQTEEAVAKAAAEYAQASLNLANTAVSNKIVSTGYYEKLGGKLEAQTGNVEASTNLIEKQVVTEYWKGKQAKRDFKWTGVNNAIDNTCKVATAAAKVIGAVKK